MFNRFITKIKHYKPEDYIIQNGKSAFDIFQKNCIKYSARYGIIAKKLQISFQGLKFRIIKLKRPKISAPLLYNSILTSVNDTANIMKLYRKKILGASIIGTLLAYSIYHYAPTRTKITLHYMKTLENLSTVSRLSYLNDTHFYPSFYLTHSLAQSIYNIKPSILNIKYHREYIPLQDGGQVCIDWALPLKQIDYENNPHYKKYYPYEPPKNNKIMFIIHGLTGGSDTQYIQCLVREAQKAGYRIAVFNHRGINQPLKTPIPSHGGDLSDIESAIDFVRSKYPTAPIVGVGTSMGGNQLLRYLGSKGKDSGFIAGVSIAAPFDISACIDAIEGTVYEKFFIKKYTEMVVLPNFDILKQLETTHGVNLDQVMRSQKLREFHTNLSLKVFSGYKNVNEYFHSTLITDRDIQNISIPILCLQAKDDPIVIQNSVPIEKLNQNPNIIYAETSHGAHLCWFSGVRPTRWYPKPTLQFLDIKLEDVIRSKTNDSITTLSTKDN